MKKDKIYALTDREQARDKISIFYGSNDNFMHGLKEVIANSVDEINSNFDKGMISIVLSDDGKRLDVEDTGRGMPVGEKNEEGQPYYELLFETLFAGGKYETDEALVGQNGVGDTVLNYTSSFFHCFSLYDGVMHTVLYNDGGQNREYKEEKFNGDKSKHGTRISFKLDDEIYTHTVFTAEDVKNIAQLFAVTSPKITINFEHKDEKVSFHYDNIEQYFDELITNQSTSSMFKINSQTFTEENEKNVYDVIITTAPAVKKQTFLNGTAFTEEGTLDSGVINGIRLTLNSILKNEKGFKPFKNSDIEDSVSYIVNLKSSKAEFANQTKFTTHKKLYERQLKKYIDIVITSFKSKDRIGFNKFVKHITEVQKANGVNSQKKAKLKKILSENIEQIGNRVDKLHDCGNHDENSELFISEGNSASSSLMDARDASYQAVYSLRGKVLNVEKASTTDIFNNQEIIDILKIIGAGVSFGKSKEYGEFNLDNVRFGKIMIATDADSDGLQISALVITMLNKLMKPFIDDGRVYIVKTPLYIVHLNGNDEVIYYHTEREKEENFKNLKNVRSISRLKGLGEVDAETMNVTAMNKDSRNIIQVTKNDVEAAEEQIQQWMGKAVDSRKINIEENLYKYIDELD